MYRISILALSLFGLITMHPVAATTHCHTVASCQKMKSEIEADVRDLLENEIQQLTGILAEDVNYYEAEATCRANGLKLPTIRQMAMIMQSMGAIGIKGTEEIDKEAAETAGYYLIKQADGNNFYFNSIGYDFFKAPLGRYIYWTSTLNAGYKTYYRVDGTLGEIITGYPELDSGHGCAGSHTAVVCVKGTK